jgi:glyoxylase-like metal-dependent hydrolase (beta-lactamase superfamily II)
VNRVRLGDLELWIVSDGVAHVDAGGMFGLVPRVLFEESHPPDAENAIAMALNCLLIRSQGKTILIDTGLGPRLTPEDESRWKLDRPAGGLVESLGRVGVSPDEVDIVINTHLHWDHCGGNTRLLDDRLEAAFPRAEYWVPRMEWADACNPDARTRGTYLVDNFDPLERDGRLVLLHGGAAVTDQVRCVVTRGHTRAHQSVILETGNWRGMFVADMASFGVHMTRTAWTTAYDVEPRENVRTKLRWQRWALETGAWLFFEHDPGIPAARLIERGDRLELEPVAEEDLLLAAYSPASHSATASRIS